VAPRDCGGRRRRSAASRARRPPGRSGDDGWSRRGFTVRPADAVYDFIDETSDRVDRGPRVSEETSREAEQLDPEELTDGADEFGLRSVPCGKFPTLLEEYLRATGDDDSRA